MDTKLSVVIPAHNAADTIGTAIQSVLDQTRPPDEIIVVDDGSVDNTFEVASRYPVTVIRRDNGGAAAARQTGTDAARGEYIAYLDDDDWYLPDNLEHVRAAMPFHFLFADFQRSYHGTTDIRPPNSTHFPRLLPTLERGRRDGDVIELSQECGEKLILDGFPVFPSTLAVRKRTLQLVGGWNPKFRRAQDFDLAVRFSHRFALHYLDRVQSIVGMHDGNRGTSDFVVKQALADADVLRATMSAEPSDSAYRALLRNALCRKYSSIGYRLREKRRYSEAWRAHWQALQYGARLRNAVRMLMNVGLAMTKT